MIIYCVLVAGCMLALGYIIGANHGVKNVTVTMSAPMQEKVAVEETLQTDPEPQEQPLVPTSALIDLNTADQALLETLPGIGPSLAQRILSYRQQIGGFTSKEQLLNVSGIGSKRYAQIEALVTVGGQE